MIRLVALILAFLALPAVAQDNHLVINELMQSNVDCLLDANNEYPDSWVELYNPSDELIHVKDYRLGLSERPEEAWTLPNTSVHPHSFLMVYCDKVANGVHTDFRLESAKGGALYLFRGDEVIERLTDMEKQPAPNIAYGRETDGSDTWGYQLSATPGEANCGSVCQRNHILGDPVFSQQGFVTSHGSSFTLSLSLPDGSPSDAYIVYTVNGSEPTSESIRYENPITITRTTCIRARVMCDGWLSRRSVTQSYIFHPRYLTLPVVSLTTDHAHLYDNKRGILVEGTYYRGGKKNYEGKWRRPINFEFFDGTNCPSLVNQLCETRTTGGGSLGSPLHSMAIYAHKRFGTKRLQCEFFPDQRPGITDFKSIVLRNAGNDFDYLYQRDAIIQLTMASHVDLDWQAYRPAIVYINGEYKGMLNLRERANEDNVYTNYNGLEDIDLFENWWDLKEGTWDNKNAFTEFYSEEGHTMAEYEEWMDCREFINLMIMNLYYHNQDFPGNNIVMWRPRSEGGRWRWIAKDTDFGLGLYNTPVNYNTIKWLYTPNYDRDRAWANQPEHTLLFRHLMDDPDFHREFIDRCFIYMGDFMNERGTRAVWDPLYALIHEEYPNHRNLFNPWWPNYQNELSSARNWLSRRSEEFFKQLKDFYNLGTSVNLKINGASERTDEFRLSFNGVPLSASKFDGRFFVGRQLSLSADEGNAGSIVKGWRVFTVAAGGVTNTQELSGSELSMTVPECISLRIDPLFEASSGIDQPTTHWQAEIHDGLLVVTGARPGSQVSVYSLQGMLLHRETASGSDIRLQLPSNQVYILKVDGHTVKLR